MVFRQLDVLDDLFMLNSGVFVCSKNTVDEKNLDGIRRVLIGKDGVEMVHGAMAVGTYKYL